MGKDKDNVLFSAGDFLLVIGLIGIAVGVGLEISWPIASAVVGTILSVIGIVAKVMEVS